MLDCKKKDIPSCYITEVTPVSLEPFQSAESTIIGQAGSG